MVNEHERGPQPGHVTDSAGNGAVVGNGVEGSDRTGEVALAGQNGGRTQPRQNGIGAISFGF